MLLWTTPVHYESPHWYTIYPSSHGWASWHDDGPVTPMSIAHGATTQQCTTPHHLANPWWKQANAQCNAAIHPTLYLVLAIHLHYTGNPGEKSPMKHNIDTGVYAPSLYNMNVKLIWLCLLLGTKRDEFCKNYVMNFAKIPKLNIIWRKT